MDKVAFHRLPVGIEHQRDRVRFYIFVRTLSTDEIAPARTPKDVISEGQRVLEVILLHNPWGTQTTSRQVVLNVVLLKHDFFQNF